MAGPIEDPPCFIIMNMYHYSAYNLNISSDIELPQLIEIPSDSISDVIIQRDSHDQMPEDIAVDGPFIGGIRGDDILLSWRSYGHFLVRSGEEILYAPAASGDIGALAAPLLGLVLGTLLHQRQVLTLHASAINYDGNAVAFVAHKGTGKSTTCASLYSRGYPIVTDDVLAVRFDDSDRVIVDPAFPTIKLHPDSVKSIGEDPLKFGRIAQTLEKRYVDASDRFAASSLPLRTIYVLENGDDFEVRELNPTEAFLQIIEHSFLVRLLGRVAAGKEHFLDCERIVKSVRIKRLVRPRDLSRMEDYLDFIEADLQANHVATEAEYDRS